jgi:hypothetical protein
VQAVFAIAGHLLAEDFFFVEQPENVKRDEEGGGRSGPAIARFEKYVGFGRL